ncbi:uncharacterized protein LOC135934574 [Cloeon dipterum]|uniref:uncharacterized protein LOC135934574 n=1 Tax=Cloeon dipterum TaxID=197152 RepID=UPI00321F65EB
MQSQKSSPSVAAMLTEAHRLYNISLNKIARSRTIRGGISLHKNLLVASVLHKTRNQIVEDTQQCWAYSNCESLKLSLDDLKEDDLLPGEDFLQPASPSADLISLQEAEDSSSDKENSLPTTYLDLDSRVRETGQPTISVLREIRPTNSGETQNSLKRRKTVSEWETEEAVLSILPKKSKSQLDDSGVADLFSEIETELADPNDPSTTMEIDRITSLVSIFSFGSLANLDAAAAAASSGNAPASTGKLTRTVSTPDLCSAQAKEQLSDSLRDRSGFIAMTV